MLKMSSSINKASAMELKQQIQTYEKGINKKRKATKSENNPNGIHVTAKMGGKILLRILYKGKGHDKHTQEVLARPRAIARSSLVCVGRAEWAVERHFRHRTPKVLHLPATAAAISPGGDNQLQQGDRGDPRDECNATASPRDAAGAEPDRSHAKRGFGETALPVLGARNGSRRCHDATSCRWLARGSAPHEARCDGDHCTHLG